ncbi:MAG: preprotein translocase subunit YajC [Clostridiales bacterium]|jgi:preprotein translocase subunit YajC|nr:preprotein translocase subunit YajC [Clostridiales bacterium]
MKFLNFFAMALGVAPEPFLSTAGESSVTETVAAGAAEGANQGGGFLLGGNNIYLTILLYAAFILVIYFLMIRPQRKRDKTFKEMQAGLKTGDSVLTTGGLYGVIAAMGEDCFIVEFGTNKSVRVPVRKAEILGVASPKIAGAPSAEQ